MPLADKIRPDNLEEIVGQDHIIGEGMFLNNMIERNFLPNMIFYGPPGTGKTTVAEIIASKIDKKIFKINATNSSTKDIKEVIDSIGSLESTNGILLYIDEIQSFNKRQQQTVLEFIEKGEITLIASTTENPYHFLFKALLSRCTILEFKQIRQKDIFKSLKISIEKIKKTSFINFKIDDDALEEISYRTKGDMRSAINILESAIYAKPLGDESLIDREYIKSLPVLTVINSDSDGEVHYDLLSALQKSIRGSDVDASLHYLARLIKAGDLISIGRRLIVIASEDIGMAYPMAQVIVKSCVDAAHMLGFPEARIPLAQAVVVLASSPKSNSSYIAIEKALYDIDNTEISEIPLHIRDAHYQGAKNLNRGDAYKYPHDYPNHYVEQQYMPDSIKDKKYYSPQENKYETNIREYLKKIKK